MKKASQTLGALAGLLLLGSFAEAGKVRIVVSLNSVQCKDTEDVTGADTLYATSFLSAGTKETAQAAITTPISINDNQSKEWGAPAVLYDGVVDDHQPLIGQVRAFDEDFAKDWAQRPKWLDEIAQKGGQALQGSGNPIAAAAGTALDYGYKLFGWVASLDKDDELRSLSLNISPTGPAEETIPFNFSKDGGWLDYSGWNYSSSIRVQRFAVQEGQPKPKDASEALNFSAVWVKRENSSPTSTGAILLQDLSFFYSLNNDKANQGLGLTDLQTVRLGDQVSVNAVWVAGQPKQMTTFGKTYQAYRDTYDQLWKAGWRLRLLDVYPAANNQYRLYNAVWEQTGGAEVQLYEASFQDVVNQTAKVGTQGLQLSLLQAFDTPQGLRYNAVWKPVKSDQPWVMGWTYEDYRKKYDQLWPQGFRLKHLQAYRIPEGVRYDAIWEKSNRPEIQLYGATFAEYNKKRAELYGQGWWYKIVRAY